MRSLVVIQNMSVDGSIEFLDDWFDPTDQDPGLLDELHRQSARSDALLLGRRTFEDFRAYWPKLTDDPTGIAGILDAQPKYVVSSTMDDPEWRNSTVLTGDWLAAVRDMKNAEGGEIEVTGSIMLCHALIEADLVDEYRLFVYPAVQGRGRRLFPEGAPRPALRLADCRSFGNGVALLVYRRRD